jgi:D-alanyl-D-alanine carboxypeptidase
MLLVVGFIQLAAADAPATDGKLGDDLQEILARFLAENESAPGASAHVECPALDLSWSGAAGTVSRESAEPLTAAHTFRIASNTKSYVAAAVLRLVEMGRLRLDDRLADNLPDDHRELLHGDGYDLEAITLLQLLSHTSGLCEHAGDPRYAEAILADPHHRWTADEQVRRCVEWCDPVGAPGERYSYSDTGYILLGGIIERATGKSLGPAARRCASCSISNRSACSLPGGSTRKMRRSAPARGRTSITARTTPSTGTPRSTCTAAAAC